MNNDHYRGVPKEGERHPDIHTDETEQSGYHLKDYFDEENSHQNKHKSTEIGFFDAIRICVLEKYATFSGRATRAEFWHFALFHTILLTFSSFLHEGADNGYVGEMALRLYLVAYVGLFIPLISVTVRRLHDTGRSGWWYWLPFPFSWILCAFESQKCDNEYGPYINA